MALSDAIADIQAKMLTLSGIKAAPEKLPETMSQFPFAVSYAKGGNVRFNSAGFADYFHTIVCEIHVARQILGQAVMLAMPYIESFSSKLLSDPKLSGTVQEVREIRYTFGFLEWAEKKHVGIRFEVDVKMNLI